MPQGIWTRENKPRLEFDRAWKWLLLPGVVIQWFLYTFPSGSFAKVVTDTRVARSPLMTYVISASFYILAVPLILLLLFSIVFAR
ncbi:hypothetical protein IF803_17085 [Bradyrhizobium sp. UFLA06-06]